MGTKFINNIQMQKLYSPFQSLPSALKGLYNSKSRVGERRSLVTIHSVTRMKKLLNTDRARLMYVAQHDII